MRKVVVRKSSGKRIGRTADVAGERRALANLMHNIDGYPMQPQKRLHGLQGTRVGRNDDPGKRGAGEIRCRRGRLLDAERRQFGILDSRIYAGAIEVQVKVALPVAE